MEALYRKIFSRALGQDFEFKIYGRGGKPVMVFPCSGGRFYDYENFGMITTLSGFIENGDIRVFAVDGRDWETWLNPVKNEQMAKRNAQWENCIINEAIPAIREECKTSEKFLATGNSAGAFHTVNFFLKYPDFFDSAIALSGFYDIRAEIGNYYDGGVYFCDPLSYLPGLNNEAILAKLRRGYAIIAHGTGKWETFNDEARRLAEILNSKGIPAWHDAWGAQYNHDWPTWKEQIQKFMSCLRDGVVVKTGTLKLIGPERRK